MNKEVIRLDEIRRDFRVGDETVHALRGVSFTIREGEFVTIMGTSGSGKSTLLNTLGCLDTPTSGEYYLDGVAVRTMDKNQRATLRNRKIGFVFQNYNLLPKTTAIENVELPLMYNSSCTASERYRRAVEALRAVGLGDRLLHKSNQMSGGQMQRALLCRAVIADPKLLILDEPANFVDNRFEKELYRTLQELNRRMAVVIVSHDIGTITSVVKEIVCVNRRAHRHRSNILTEEQLRNYDCPIQLVSHGHIPHTVLEHHPGDGCCDGE